MIKIKKGLDLPISGKPAAEIHPGNEIKHVALLGHDYVGMKPRFEVEVGDSVKLGQLLFFDKKMPAIRYTSPGGGKVAAIHRGPKRIFLSIIIELEGNDEVVFSSYNKPDSLDRETIVNQLIESGQWTALRARPFSKVADPAILPHSIFVTAIDTNPLAPSIDRVIQDREEDLIHGLQIISKLTTGKVYVCKSPQTNLSSMDMNGISIETFDGPHPSGLVGTHIHFLDPVHRDKTVWYIGIQDVISVGHLFLTGHIDVERIVSLAGPGVQKPGLIRTRIGASVGDLTEDKINDGDQRIISGSVLSGFTAEGEMAFIGRYHQQISIISEYRKLGFFGWLNPGFNLFSLKRVTASHFLPKKMFGFTTAAHGGKRAIVPVGSYEKVMPLDILPNYLLRALAVDDIEEAEKLGCLELDEEDLALCTFVCPSKINHGQNLRRNLTIIEKEG